MSDQCQIPVDVDRVSALLESVGDTGDDRLIPILQKIQDEYGYLPQDVLRDVSERVGIPFSRMYGVATFYEQFYFEPRGKHTIKCCRGTACHVKSGAGIRSTIEDLLEVKDGGSTEDMRFTFETVACLGTCFLAPVVMVDDNYYGNLVPKQLRSILEDYE